MCSNVIFLPACCAVGSTLRTLVRLGEHSLNRPLCGQFRGVQPPTKVAEAGEHRLVQLWVAVEEELLDGRPGRVALNARIRAGIEDKEAQPITERPTEHV